MYFKKKKKKKILVVPTNWVIDKNKILWILNSLGYEKNEEKRR